MFVNGLPSKHQLKRKKVTNSLEMLPVYFIFFLLGVTNVFRVEAVEGPGAINDLPQFELYVPEKKQDVPVLLGERSKFFFLTGCNYFQLKFHVEFHVKIPVLFLGCDNIYHGAILPCLLRPDLPPYSYKWEHAYNVEYKKKKKRSTFFLH